ncbi:MAG: hypothetical protein ACKVVP_19880, partial [Chloroflexota bacterium]
GVPARRRAVSFSLSGILPDTAGGRGTSQTNLDGAVVCCSQPAGAWHVRHSEAWLAGYEF